MSSKAKSAPAGEGGPSNSLHAPENGGSRTFPGRARSRFNALKHGVLAAAALLRDESAEEYAALVSDLHRVLLPEGKLEEALVEKVASTLWRYRRLLKAEAAEIDAAKLRGEHTGLDDVRRQIITGNLWPGSLNRALMTKDGPGLLAEVQVLSRLASRITGEGLDWERDRETLERLFGKADSGAAPVEDPSENAEPVEEFPTPQNDPAATIPGLYLKAVRESEGKRLAARRRAAEVVVRKLLSLVDGIEPDARVAAERSTAFDQLRAIKLQVPSGDTAEKVIRYEAHLDRVLDRALTQLERLQRIRRGHPVPPPLKVELSR